VEVPKDEGVAEGVVEFDLAEAKDRFVKQVPKEFGADVTPELYAWLEHKPRDRAEHLHLDAWTGNLITRPVKVTIRMW
jgi:hypothetical protein